MAGKAARDETMEWGVCALRCRPLSHSGWERAGHAPSTGDLFDRSSHIRAHTLQNWLFWPAKSFQDLLVVQGHFFTALNVSGAFPIQNNLTQCEALRCCSELWRRVDTKVSQNHTLSVFSLQDGDALFFETFILLGIYKTVQKSNTALRTSCRTMKWFMTRFQLCFRKCR
jgi:hypothetical protein